MKTMQGNAQGLGMFRTVAGITAIGVLLGACTSPTYGTGKTAAEQLVDDLGNATSITGDQTKRNLKYSPRPGLVVPAQSRAEQLAAPQQNMANAKTTRNGLNRRKRPANVCATRRMPTRITRTTARRCSPVTALPAR